MSFNDANVSYTDRQIQSSFQPPITIPPVPLNANEVSSAPAEQQEVAPTADVPQQQPLRSDAPSFVPSTNSFIYDLNKYKHDYFLSKLSCSFDFENARFGSPTGICTLNDDRLLVANYDRDSLLLLDIQGTVYQIYRDLPAPKDILYCQSNPNQAVVATKKEVIILDLETKQVVVRSKIRGFYPWNIQYIPDYDTFAACDPSSEKIIYLNKNLDQLGSWSLNDQAPGQMQGYSKKYPYAAHFFSDNTSLVLTHVEDKCRLAEHDTASGALKQYLNTPAGFKSYSIFADSERKCLVADKTNRRLVSVKPDSTFEEYKWSSVREPHSMTFLSTGTLCVTDSSTFAGTNGGIAILSESDLKTIA